MQNEILEDTTGSKKHYEPPELLRQDHMTRVTKKTDGLDDGAPGNTKKHRPGEGGGGQGGLLGGGGEGASGEGSGGLFDTPFDE